jgi:tetratricopeptide (TPR) repeat protein
MSTDDRPPTTPNASLPDFDKLWNYGKPAETEATFRELLPAAVRPGNASYRLQLLTQVARCQGLQGKFADAHATLDRVAADLTDELPLPRVRYLLERGRVFNSSDRPADAMPLFQEAWDAASRAGEMRYAVDALHMVAIAAPTPAERVQWGERCLEVIAANPAQDGWLTSVLNNLGEAYRASGGYEESLACFQRILERDRAAGREPWLYNRVDEARLLRLVGRANDALTKIQAIATELPQPDGFVEEEYGECLIALGRPAEGTPHSANAWRLLQGEDWLRTQEPARWERLRDLNA